MRAKFVAKNTLFSFLSEVVLLLFGMIMPRLIILRYGSAINGLTSTITNILSLLNLLQAGAVGASIYAMYAPVAQNDYLSVSAIMDSSRRYFTKLGLIFLSLVVLVAPAVGIFKASPEIDAPEIIFSVMILGVNSSFNFFFVSWYDILFSAHQRRYFISIGGIVEKLAYYGLLFAILNSSLPFITMYAAVLIGNITKVIYLNMVYRRHYAKLIPPPPKENTYKVGNRNYLLVTQIAMQGVEASSTVLLTALYDFRIVSVYAVHNLVQNAIRMVIDTIQYSFSASLGNLIASEDDAKVSRVYDMIRLGCCCIGLWLGICVAFMFMPFVTLYTKGISDVNYYRPFLILAIVLQNIVYCLYVPFMQLSNGYGLFREVYKQSAVCATISIALSGLLASMDMSLILIGPIFYYLSGFVYRVRVVRRNCAWYEPQKLIIRTLFVMILPVVSYLAEMAVGLELQNWLQFFLACAVVGICALGIVLLYCGIFERGSWKYIRQYASAFIRKDSGNNEV